MTHTAPALEAGGSMERQSTWWTHGSLSAVLVPRRPGIINNILFLILSFGLSSEGVPKETSGQAFQCLSLYISLSCFFGLSSQGVPKEMPWPIQLLPWRQAEVWRDRVLGERTAHYQRYLSLGGQELLTTFFFWFFPLDLAQKECQRKLPAKLFNAYHFTNHFTIHFTLIKSNTWVIQLLSW